MFFGLFKRKARAPVDPLVLFDGAIEAAELDAGELRKSAATLLALKGTLERDAARFAEERRGLLGRLDEAVRSADAKAARLLEADARQAEAGQRAAEEALARVAADAELLVEGARETAARVEGLKAERAAAAARLLAGKAAGTAMQAEGARLSGELRLSQARDEVERARALAEIWREDRKQR